MHNTWKSFYLRGFLSLLLWGICVFVVFILWFAHDLPDIKNLRESGRRPNVTILDQDGEVLAKYGDVYDKTIRVEELPAHVPNALLAIEDVRFYRHFGLDIIGLARAMYANYKANRVVQGGSTITQQLAKNFLQSQKLYDYKDRSLRRKIQELLMAIWLELNFSKKQILTIYLNRVYFGAGTYGIEAAAKNIFGKSAKDLGVYEAALMFGLLQAPSKYSPFYNPEKAHARAKVVLSQMEKFHFIDSAAKYSNSKLDFGKQNKINEGSRFFCDWVYDLLPNFVGNKNYDLIVHSTLNSKLQKDAEQSCKEIMAEWGTKFKTSQIALVTMTPNGAVRAMFGGMDYNKSQFNRVTIGKRPAGSTFKMPIYLAALEAGLTPETQIDDSNFYLGKWFVHNSKRYEPHGSISIEYAFAKSINTVAVRLLQKVGIPRVHKTVGKLGISTDLPENMTIALGTADVTLLELTAAFATFPNHGKEVWPYGIKKITTASGKVLYERHDENLAPIISQRVLQGMQKILDAVIEYGTGASNAKLPAEYDIKLKGGKTGSNQDFDAWFVGYTDKLVTGVWTGNDDNKPMLKQSVGSQIPARTWKMFMAKALKAYIPEEGDVASASLPPQVQPQPKEQRAPDAAQQFFESPKNPTENRQFFESHKNQVTQEDKGQEDKSISAKPAAEDEPSSPPQTEQSLEDILEAITKEE